LKKIVFFLVSHSTRAHPVVASSMSPRLPGRRRREPPRPRQPRHAGEPPPAFLHRRVRDSSSCLRRDALLAKFADVMLPAGLLHLHFHTTAWAPGATPPSSSNPTMALRTRRGPKLHGTQVRGHQDELPPPHRRAGVQPIR